MLTWVVKQVESSFVAKYEVLDDSNNIIASAEMSNVIFGSNWRIYYGDKVKYNALYKFKQQLGNIAKSNKNKLYIPFEIYDDSNIFRMGIICQKQSDGFFLSRYGYYELKLNNKTYTVYAVGLGKEGVKLPIYIGDTQVALIEKSATVKNNLDEYVIHALTDEYANASYLVCLYIDTLSCSHRGEKVTASTQTAYVYTTNRELKSKYNPNFIKEAH